MTNCGRAAKPLTPVLLLVATWSLLTRPVALAQQDPDVTVIVKAESKPASLPTLLILCDLGCNWKLDGEAKGHIGEGGSAKIKVEPGQHMVEASTDDGVDRVKMPSTVKSTGQTMVSIELQPIRDERLEMYRQEMAQAEKDEEYKAARERADKDRQEREAQARDRLAAGQ
jgi:hypothetical protein